jgi:hypothetical protein
MTVQPASPGSETTPPVTGTSGQKPVTPGLNTPLGTKAGSEEDADKRDKVASLRAEADELERTLPPPSNTERLKVTAPHESFGFGGVWVGTDWSPVPVHMVAGVMQAAAEAGVSIIQEG